MGILLMGFIGYFIKLVHIPINYIIVYVLLPSSKPVLTVQIVAPKSCDPPSWGQMSLIKM